MVFCVLPAPMRHPGLDVGVNEPVVKAPFVQLEKANPETVPAVSRTDCDAETSTGKEVPLPPGSALIEPPSMTLTFAAPGVQVVLLYRVQATDAPGEAIVPPVATVLMRTVPSVKDQYAAPEFPVAVTS